jgi:hypothetical protein
MTNCIISFLNILYGVSNILYGISPYLCLEKKKTGLKLLRLLRVYAPAEGPTLILVGPLLSAAVDKSHLHTHQGSGGLAP